MRSTDYELPGSEKYRLLNEDMERRIIRGLQWEWLDTSSYYLHRQYNRAFSLPLFTLKKMTALGRWDSERNEIALNRDFVMTHKWEYVVAVLRHEMAHQYVSRCLGNDDRPHGPLFKKACRIFRINPDASVTLPGFNDTGAEKSDDRIVAKVHKLLALAQSSNQNEAEAAMQKAQRLIHYYNIDLIEQDSKRNYCSCRLGEVKLRHRREEYALTRFLTEFYFVQVISIATFMMERDRHALNENHLPLGTGVGDSIVWMTHQRLISWIKWPFRPAVRGGPCVPGGPLSRDAVLGRVGRLLGSGDDPWT